jgi:8-oxo-dGTP diphosphatase
MDLKEFVEQDGKAFLPNLSVDMVIIGLKDGDLKCLLLQIGKKWLLPGGYIRKDESVEEAAKRTLWERTGLHEPHLKFLSVFGDPDRQFSAELKEFLVANHMPWREDYWFNNRFVTLAYYSLVNIDEINPKTQAFEHFSWVSFAKLPSMWMDHKKIVLEARNRLKQDIRQERVTHKLLPDQFTMPELHQLHEIILEEKIDRSRFQKNMLASGVFKRLPKKQTETPGRNPYLYSVRK